MSKKKERGFWELYAKDPEKADAQIWGRKSNPLTRRGFIKKSGLAAMTMAIGSEIPFFRNMPDGFIPLAFAEKNDQKVIEGKEGLIVLNDRPVNIEPPAHLLNDEFTPNEKHFVRNNGLSPEGKINANKWMLTVNGEVHKPFQISLGELKSKFKHHTYALQLECAGNGRAGYNPPAKGNQWKFGAVGCAKYKGVRLGEVLKAAELKGTAIYTGYYGADVHLSENPDKEALSRGTPIPKALDDHTLIAWEMNGEPLPAPHGFPLRLITPGWPGSTSPKWLNRIWVRDRVHDGMKMNKYRVPKYPVKPGTSVPLEDMAIIESMPVKSLITNPKTGIQIPMENKLEVRGHAWAGDRSVREVHVSINFGRTWEKTDLKKPVNRYAWQNWNTVIQFPKQGYYEVWARATDIKGEMQPMVVPGWNPSGYINNAMHRIAVTVG